MPTMSATWRRVLFSVGGYFCPCGHRKSEGLISRNTKTLFLYLLVKSIKKYFRSTETENGFERLNAEEVAERLFFDWGSFAFVCSASIFY
jgi:hypothetical protein